MTGRRDEARSLIDKLRDVSSIPAFRSGSIG
jgi:hypothetical protein